MQASVHLLAGAAIAVLVPHTPTALVLAFFSHYLLDMVPHIDPETFADGKTPYNIKQRIGLIADIVLVITLFTALFIIQKRSVHVLLGAIAAQVPDLLMPLERYRVMWPLKRIHLLLHWNGQWATERSWYLVGIFAPITVAVFSLFIIWRV